MGRRKYKQGIFNPCNPKKYTGTQPILFRSGLELKFMQWADRNSVVVEWGSESVIIPYLKPSLNTKQPKIHKYYVDFNLKLRTKNGIKKYLVEVKPFRQTQPPKPHGNKKHNTLLYEQFHYAVNSSKWASAQKWCEQNGYKFIILTEKDLN